MGQIQSSINQIIGQAGALAHLSPEFRAKAEKRAKVADLKKEAAGVSAAGKEASLSAQATIAEAELEPDENKQIELRETAHRDLGDAMELVNQKEAIAKEMFKLEPSEESYGKYKKIREGNIQINKEFAKMQESLDRMREKGMAKITQKAKRRDFMKALGAEPINFGAGYEGTVKDVPKNLQKAIAAQYTKSQRKELMDRYYGK